MALWALLVIFGIVEYLGLIVSLVDGFVGKGSTSHVVSTVAIVEFLHHLVGFVWSKTPYVRVGVQLRVRLSLQDIPGVCTEWPCAGAFALWFCRWVAPYPLDRR